MLCNVCGVCMNVCRHTMICKLYVVHMLQLCAHHTAGSGRPVDLFFVLDSSMSQRPQGFTRQKDLVANLTSRLNIGPNQTQVSLSNGVGPPPLYPRPPPPPPLSPRPLTPQGSSPSDFLYGVLWQGVRLVCGRSLVRPQAEPYL